LSDQKADYVWFNGKTVPWNDAKVHVLTHAFNYGTAAFEGIRVYPKRDEMFIFRLSDHVKRLFNSAKIYGFEVGYSQEEIFAACVQTVKANNLHVRSYIRPLVYVAGVGVGIGFLGQPIGVAVVAVPFDTYFTHRDGVHAVVSSWRRLSEQSMPPSAKITGHYANSVLAKMNALENGYGEAILLDISGRVSEGTGENIFIVKGGRLHTPSPAAGILEGITRRSVMELAEDEGLEVIERDIVRSELYTCEEAFFAGTAAEITPILSIDKKPVADGTPGQITRRIRSLFEKAVVGELQNHSDWVTPVYRQRQTGASRFQEEAKLAQPRGT
jgi:branched-chain amino acid aminotransferase